MSEIIEVGVRMQSQATVLERALGVLGPLEGRIMHAVWSGTVGEPFIVRDVQALMPELAYTTVMTTLNRLADKGLLAVRAVRGRRAHEYQLALDPERFLARASREHVEQVVKQFGDAAMVAFAEQLGQLSPERRRRLEEMGGL